jgi:hypothetical protein
LRSESLGLSEILNFNSRVSALVDDLEGPRFDILLDNRVLITATDKTPEIFVSPGATVVIWRLT